MYLHCTYTYPSLNFLLFHLKLFPSFFGWNSVHFTRPSVKLDCCNNETPATCSLSSDHFASTKPTYASNLLSVSQHCFIFLISVSFLDSWKFPHPFLPQLCIFFLVLCVFFRLTFFVFTIIWQTSGNRVSVSAARTLQLSTQMLMLRIFQRNRLKLDKDLVFLGWVQNVYMSIEWRSLRKFDRSVFTQWNSKVEKKCMDSYGSSKKWR